MTWVINAAWYPLLSCKLALHGNINLGHVTNCKTIIFGSVMDDVILLSTRICGFTTHWSLDRELYAYRVFGWVIQGPHSLRVNLDVLLCWPRTVGHMSSYIIIMRLCWLYCDEHTLFFGLVKSKCNEKHMFQNICKAETGSLLELTFSSSYILWGSTCCIWVPSVDFLFGMKKTFS
jgi:hypothetical protein